MNPRREWLFVGAFTLVAMLLGTQSATSQAPQQGKKPLENPILQIAQQPKLLTQARTALRMGMRAGCDHGTLRKNAAIRWVQNSGIFPYAAFESLPVRSPTFAFKEEAEVLKSIEEHSDDTNQNQDDPNAILMNDEILGKKMPESGQKTTQASAEQLKDTKLEVFAAPMTIKFIEDLSEKVWPQIQTPLLITSMTSGPNKKRDAHCTHFGGFAFDMRPLPGNGPTAWWFKDKKLYDRKMNKNFLMELLKDDAVKSVIFNDPYLHKDPDIQRAIKDREVAGRVPVKFFRQLSRQMSGGALRPNSHHYHIHVELYPPEEVAEYADDLLKVTAISPRRVAAKSASQPGSKPNAQKPAYQ